MYILGTIIIVLFWILFFSIKVFSQVRSYDGWADQKSQKIFFSLEKPKFLGPQLDLFYREFPATTPMKEWGALLELRWEVGQNFQFGGFVGGSVVQVDDLVEDPTLNHLGRVTREGLFFGISNNPKKFFAIAISARIGHMWQLRPGDEIPGGWHAFESELQLKAGIRFPTGKGSFLIPHLLVGTRHLSQKKQPHEGFQPFVGLGISVTGYL